MKKIYKVSISILIISMFAAIAISSPTGPYTGCVSATSTPTGLLYNFQPGANPTNTCKSGDDQITMYEKIYLDGALNNLQMQLNNLGSGLNSLIDRVTNLENDPYPKLYTMKYNFTRFNVNDGDSPLANLTFTLPKDAIVQVQVDGMFINWLGYAAIGFDDFSNDGQNCIDWCQMAWYGDGKYDGSGEWTGFEQSKSGYFKAGTHTIKVHGLAYGSASFQTDNSVAVWTRISATAYDVGKGNIQQMSGSDNKIIIEPSKPLPLKIKNNK